MEPPSGASRSEGVSWRIAGARPGPHSFNAELPLAGETRYVVGRSDPDRDWPRTSAGPLDDSSDYLGATFTVVFDGREGVDRVAHRLLIEGEEGSGPMPDLRISNGAWEAFVTVQRRRDDRAHAPLPPGPTAGLFRFELEIPVGAIASGANELRIRTETPPASADHGPEARRDRRSPGSWFGNTWHWRSIDLSPVDAAAPTRVELESLPLFRRAAGGVRPLVRLCLRGRSRGAEDVELIVGGRSYALGEALTIAAGDFGDMVATFEVEEFQEPTEAEVRVGESRHRFFLSPARKWILHVIPQVHLDLGYTDRQAKITEIHTANIDRALAIGAAHPGYRYTIDGSYVADAYERTRSAAAVERFRREVNAGGLGLNAFWATPLTGLCTREELTRGMAYAAAARRAGWAPMRSANLTDVPSYTGALPSVLVGAGVRRFFGIANHMRGGNADSDELHLRSPLRWTGPDGAEVIVFFADCYTQLRTVCADQPSVFGAAIGISRLLTRYERPDYPHVDLPLYGTHADNEDLGSGYADLVERWNAEYAWPRLRFSTIDDYFDAIEASGAELPGVAGDGGSFWEDGAGTAPQLHRAHRALQTTLPEAEALSGLVTTGASDLRADTSALDELWRGAIVGGEHTFTASYATDAPTADGVVAQLAWKQRQVDAALARSDDVRLQAMAQLGDRIDIGAVPAVLVVNPSSWVRADWIDIELPASHGLRGPNRDLLPARPLGPITDGRQWSRVQIPELPPFGYCAFELAAMPSPPSPTSFAIEQGRTRLGAYEVVVEGGRIAQLIHEATGRELLDRAGRYAFGDVVVATGGGSADGRGRGGERTSLWDYHPLLPAPVIEETVASPTALEVVRFDDETLELRWGIEAEGNLTGRVALAARGEHLTLNVEVDKRPEFAKQSVYVAFPFRRFDTVEFDRQQGWWDPETGLPGAGHEWYTACNVVVGRDEAGGIAWSSRDAALVVFDEPVRGDWRTRHRRETGTILSWVTNNYWYTNTPASQQGSIDLHYRFGVSNGRPADLRMGLECRSRLSSSVVTVADRRDPWPRPMPPSGSLWLHGAPENVLVHAFPSRVAERELLIRVQEIAGEPCEIDLRLPGSFRSLRECSDLEDVAGFVGVTVTDAAARIALEPFQVRSFLTERTPE